MSKKAPNPDLIDVTAEYVLQLNDYLKKNLKASLSGLNVYKAALKQNPNLLKDNARNDERKAFLGTLVEPYKNKLTKKYWNLLQTFDSDWQTESIDRVFETTIVYVNELNRQLILHFGISYNALEEYKEEEIINDFVTNEERGQILENLKKPFIQKVLNRFVDLVDTFNERWLEKQSNEKLSHLAIADVDKSFINGFKEIDETMIEFGCPADINFENFYKPTYREDVLANPDNAINGKIFKLLADSYTKFLIKTNLDDLCKQFLENHINTLIETIARKIDSKNRLKSDHRIRSQSRGRDFRTESLAISFNKIKTDNSDRHETIKNFSSHCAEITYKDQLLVQEDYGGKGECFFKAMGALFQKFGVNKSDEIVRKEFCDFTRDKIVEMLRNEEHETVISKFDAVFQGNLVDRNDVFDRRVISTIVKNVHTTYPYHLTTEEITNFILTSDHTLVAETLVSPTRYTLTNSGHESWANENTIFAAGDYMVSVLHGTPVTGLIILNCVKAPQALLLPDFPEYRYRDLVRDRVVVEKFIDPEKVINKLLIVRVGGNHYVVGAHPIEVGEEPRSRYLFDVLQSSWSLQNINFV